MQKWGCVSLEKKGGREKKKVYNLKYPQSMLKEGAEVVVVRNFSFWL